VTTTCPPVTMALVQVNNVEGQILVCDDDYADGDRTYGRRDAQ
jgi:hypothetical protein